MPNFRFIIFDAWTNADSSSYLSLIFIRKTFRLLVEPHQNRCITMACALPFCRSITNDRMFELRIAFSPAAGFTRNYFTVAVQKWCEICVKSTSTATTASLAARYRGCQYMDICFYCYFLFSCVPQQFKFYEADRMRRTTNGEKEKKTKDLFVGKSLMCNHKLLNDEEEKTQKNSKAFRRKNWILFTLFGFARLLSIQVIRAHAHTHSAHGWL